MKVTLESSCGSKIHLHHRRHRQLCLSSFFHEHCQHSTIRVNIIIIIIIITKERVCPITVVMPVNASSSTSCPCARASVHACLRVPVCWGIVVCALELVCWCRPGVYGPQGCCCAAARRLQDAFRIVGARFGTWALVPLQNGCRMWCQICV